MRGPCLRCGGSVPTVWAKVYVTGTDVHRAAPYCTACATQAREDAPIRNRPMLERSGETAPSYAWGRPCGADDCTRWAMKTHKDAPGVYACGRHADELLPVGRASP